MYHQLHVVMMRALRVSEATNPLLRILVSQDAVAVAAYAVSFASPATATLWLRTSIAAMITQVVQGVLADQKRSPTALVGLLSSILVALAFSRSLKLAQRTAQEAAVYTMAYLLLQKPILVAVDVVINALRMKRTEKVRRDF